MGWQDRDYNQSGAGSGTANPVLNVLMGSVSIGTWFGIRVRIHATLIILVIFRLLGSHVQGDDLADRAISMAALFAIILLHEFGHCFASRWMGGQPDDILMWPLGGLASANPPHRPIPTLVTVIGGPAVNVIICLITGLYLFLVVGDVPLNPFNPVMVVQMRPSQFSMYVGWVYLMSYYLLLFNLLPIFPLDGGQILQSSLWWKIGYYRSMLIACTTGMIGAVMLTMFGAVRFDLMLIFIGISSFVLCYQRRQMLREMGPEAMAEADLFELAAAESHAEPKRKRLSARAIKKAQRAAAEERAEQERIDEILAKVSAQGMSSLTWTERRALKKATERQRQRDLELSRRYN
jgi:stage IV sporulation protein FB